MKSRSNPVIVYKNKQDILHCRIGIGNSVIECHRVCHLIKNHPHICCVFDSRNNTPTTKFFYFDNTEHTICLSINKCMLCYDCTDGISRCRYNIKKYIDAFVDNINKVEIEVESI